MPAPPRPCTIHPHLVERTQQRFSYGPPVQAISPLWTAGPDGSRSEPPDLGKDNPDAWGPWITKSSDVFYCSPEAPTRPVRVAALLHQLVGHPAETGTHLLGPVWAYSLRLDPAFFSGPAGRQPNFSGSKAFLIETLAYLICSKLPVTT